MIWTLRLLGESLQFHQDKQPPLRRSLTSEDTARFSDWAGRYDRAVKARNHGELLQIGQEAFAWLEAEGHGWGGKLTGGAGPVCLDVVTDEDPAGGTRALLDVPWELLARGDVHLAEDALRPFCVQRRLGEPRAPATPRYKDLAVMFMAAAPRNVEPVLDFEAEEAGILAATDNLPLALTVEESGCAAFLKDRLADDGPFEVMHLTCHGAIGKDGPVLALEDEGGDLYYASAAELADTLGGEKPGLLFVSACRSAEDGGDESAPLAILLTRADVPAVLGWDGSVHDTDASHFAREMYAALAHHDTPAFAVAKARQYLLAAHRADAREGQHWHLARLYVGPEGGGALCAKHAKARPSHRGLAYRTFLGKERQQVPVAGPAAFVGRRRQLQDVFRAFRDPATPGVLIHGFGGQGKSSLAARVADRCPHHRVALVFKFYDAQAVFEQALQAVIGAEAVALRDTWQPLIAKDASNLKGALEAILSGPFADFELDSQDRVAHQPLLLIIDDLEQILDKPAAGAGAKAAVNAAHKPALAAVLEAFAANTGQSRLLLTSRYDFALKIGIEVILVFSDASLLLFGLAAIPLVLAARAISVGVPMLGLQHLSPLSPGSFSILVLGGVRGGISIALALSVPSGPYKEMIIAATYVVVLFSVLLQAPAVGIAARRLFAVPADGPPPPIGKKAEA